MKFDEAYCETDMKTYTIEEISRLYNLHLDIFVKEYKDHFLCPECHTASLTFVNASIPYFRTYPNSKHLDDCFLKQEEMDQAQLKNYLADKDNTDSVNRQIQNALASLFVNNQEFNSDKEAGHMAYTSASPRSFESIYERKRIPRKRIDLPFREEDFDCTKIFYGTVNLQWLKAKHSNSYKLILSSPTAHKRLCILAVTEKVYMNLNPTYKNQDFYLCNIAFLSEFQKERNESNNPLFSFLRTSQYLVIEKL